MCVSKGRSLSQARQSWFTYRIDEHRDLFENSGYKTVEGLHPVARQQEIPIHVEVAAVITINFGA